MSETVAQRDDRVAWVREAFGALVRGNLNSVESLMAEDVRWQGTSPGPGDCLNREEVRQMLSSLASEGALASVEVCAVDRDRIAVITASEGPELVHVLTFVGDRVALVQACRDRAEIETLPPRERPARSTGVRADATSRPQTLVPFVQVADIERSIGFYETLGFDVVDTHGHDGRVDWAALRAGHAELMLTHGEPLDARAQGVLFYLHSRDLSALRETLVRAGIAVTAIGDGSPGPRQEMRATDPDGYCLMIAQVEE